MTNRNTSHENLAHLEGQRSLHGRMSISTCSVCLGL